jgi:hypothetical protein
MPPTLITAPHRARFDGADERRARRCAGQSPRLDPQGVTDRYDPEPLLVFVDEGTNQRCSASRSRVKKVVAWLDEFDSLLQLPVSVV